MAQEAEYGYKLRIIKLLLLLVEQPGRLKKKDLQERLGVTASTIERDLDVLRNAGLLVKCDDKYRYALQKNQHYRQLKDLLHFTEEDQLLLADAIDRITGYSNRGKALKDKLGSLYDYHKLGHAYLRKPYLERMNALEGAIRDKQQVVLKAYRSTNSNVTSDRLVEPFHINPPEDVVQCFDVDKHELRYFRMSRFERVEATGTPWAHEGKHFVMPADPFRIVDNNQISVHIRLKVGAYNDMLERFPLTKGYLEPSNEPDWYDFQCRVNHEFTGLENFLLGNWKDVQIIEPEQLKNHLDAIVQRMRF